MTESLRPGYSAVRLISAKQLCDDLGISKTVIQRWRREGKLIARKMMTGKRRYKLRFLESEVLACMDLLFPPLTNEVARDWYNITAGHRQNGYQGRTWRENRNGKKTIP